MVLQGGPCGRVGIADLHLQKPLEAYASGGFLVEGASLVVLHRCRRLVKATGAILKRGLMSAIIGELAISASLKCVKKLKVYVADCTGLN